jgi:hypothetical protein
MSPPVERLVRRLDEFLGSLFVQGLMMLTLIVLVVLVAVSAVLTGLAPRRPPIH